MNVAFSNLANGLGLFGVRSDFFVCYKICFVSASGFDWFYGLLNYVS